MSREDQLSRPATDRAESNPAADDIRLQIDVRMTLDEVASVEAELLRRGRPDQPTRGQLTQLAGNLRRSQNSRSHIIDPSLR